MSAVEAFSARASPRLTNESPVKASHDAAQPAWGERRPLTLLAASKTAHVTAGLPC